MQRRSFTKKFLLSLTLASGFAGSGKAKAILGKKKKPKRLKKGDTIGLISPASYIADEGLEKAVKNLESLGFKVKLGQHIRKLHGFVAGTDQERLEDLHNMFADPGIDGIWCVRGGYGSARLLPLIDYTLVKKNPKVLIGYSDITALLQGIYIKTGLVCFHGPVGASELTDFTREQLVAVLMEGRAPHMISIPEKKVENDADGETEKTDNSFEPFLIKPGKVSGELAGGNLSLLAAITGTEYELDVEGKLLFIEDVGEKPYRIDRMLTQLRQAYPMHKVAGIALGVFSGCEAKEGDKSLTLRETLGGQLSGLNLPVLYGLPFGHIDDHCTLPLGIVAELDAGMRTITLLESAVV